MWSVYYDDGHKILVIKKQLGDVNDCYAVMQDYLKEHNIKSYYTRTTTVDNETLWIDYGSHTKFFWFNKE